MIAGRSTSALDERVKNKRNWKVGLINKYENNQDAWGELTNSFVNKLKEEVKYTPGKETGHYAKSVQTTQAKHEVQSNHRSQTRDTSTRRQTTEWNGSIGDAK